MTGIAARPGRSSGSAVVMIVYTYVGGVRAVIWTEFAQFGIYIGGALLAFGLLLDRLPGGWSDLVAIGGAAGKLRVFDLSIDSSEPYALWAGLFGGIFVTFGSHGVDQTDGAALLLRQDVRRRAQAVVVGGFVVLVRSSPSSCSSASASGPSTRPILPAARVRSRTIGSSLASFSTSCPSASSACCSARSSPRRCRPCRAR